MMLHVKKERRVNDSFKNFFKHKNNRDCHHEEVILCHSCDTYEHYESGYKWFTRDNINEFYYSEPIIFCKYCYNNFKKIQQNVTTIKCPNCIFKNNMITKEYKTFQINGIMIPNKSIYCNDCDITMTFEFDGCYHGTYKIYDN